MVTTTRTFEASVLFQPNGTELTAQAQTALRDLVRRSGTKAITITCTGYVKPTAATWNDTELSTARAREAAKFLRGLGVTGNYITRGGGPGRDPTAASRRATVTVTVGR